VQKAKLSFKPLHLPAGDVAWVPTDIDIRIPVAPRIATEDLHYLAYIPWSNRYLKLIPSTYRDFFKYVLPNLHTRTSDVHTALSVAQVPYLLKNTSATVDLDALYYALMLHDVGWSKVSPKGLVASLSYNGTAPTSKASMMPKQQHLIYGEALAYKLLNEYPFGPDGPNAAAQYYISEIIRRHDNDAPWENGKYGEISVEMELMCDGDRLWSYTHENFWLDTVRKGIEPESYIDNIDEAIDTYFFTDQGKTRARQLVTERRTEVATCLYARAEAPSVQPKPLLPHAWRLHDIGRRLKV
jgi:hypothetical protein